VPSLPWRILRWSYLFQNILQPVSCHSAAFRYSPRSEFISQRHWEVVLKTRLVYNDIPYFQHRMDYCRPGNDDLPSYIHINHGDTHSSHSRNKRSARVTLNMITSLRLRRQCMSGMITELGATGSIA